jgi:5'-deoxynucleotidase YfbR-like HD superfamily hydrolase
LVKAFANLNEHIKNVESINNEGDIAKVEAANAKYDEYERLLDSCSYLKNINEDIIYNAYTNAIQANHSREFEDFSQAHRDSYMRLKLRDLPYSNVKPKDSPVEMNLNNEAIL